MLTLSKLHDRMKFLLVLLNQFYWMKECSDLCQIMNDEHTAVVDEDSLQNLFWKQQKESMSKQKNGMHWHPLMIRWCLYLRHMSGKAFETLRESGLPSQCTLRDYSHCVQSGAGVTSVRAAKLSSSPEWHKLIVLRLTYLYFLI